VLPAVKFFPDSLQLLHVVYDFRLWRIVLPVFITIVVSFLTVNVEEAMSGKLEDEIE
jgi:hypothetical protein